MKAATLRSFPARYTLIVWLACLYFLPVELLFMFLGYPDSGPTEDMWWNLTYYYVGDALLVVWLLLVARHVRLPVRQFFGPLPALRDWRWLLPLFVGVWIISYALTFLVFFPLALVWPEFVQAWLFAGPEFVHGLPDELMFVPNLLSLITLVVLAPIIEEVLFRGYLLHRWGTKYGLGVGVALSSILFGLAHPDVFAATFFAVVLSVVYLRTQSLYIPILFHALWNGVYWIWAVADKVIFAEQSAPDVDEFLADWAYGVVAMCLSAVVLVIYHRRGSGTGQLRLALDERAA